MPNSERRPIAAVVTWLLTLSAMLVASPATAQTWRVDYDPSLGTLPSGQGWTHFLSDPLPADGLTEANYSVAAGVLTQGPTGGINADVGNRQWSERTVQPFDFDDDVIEIRIRLRVVSSTLTPPPGQSPRAGFGVSVADADGRLVILYFGSAGLFLYGSNQGTSPLIDFDTTATFVDYQLRIDDKGAWVRADGEELAFIPRNYYGVGATPNRISFGDLTLIDQSHSELERYSFGRFNPSVDEVRNYQWSTLGHVANSENGKTIVAQCPNYPGSSESMPLLAGGAEVLPSSAREFLTLKSVGATGPIKVEASAIERVPWEGSWWILAHTLCGEFPGLESHSHTDLVLAGEVEHATGAYCPTAKLAISGGATNLTVLGTDEHPTIESSGLGYVLGVPTGWRTTGKKPASTPNWFQEANVVCGDWTDRTVTTGQSATDATAIKSAIAVCPPGNVPIGGGGRISGDPDRGRLVGSYPEPVFDSIPRAWVAIAAANTDAFPSDWNLEATAICVPTAEPNVARRGLVGRWRADSGFPLDEKGQNDGLLINGATIVPGLVDQAFSFGDTNQDWLHIPGEDFYPAGPFSVSAFIQTSAATGATATIASLYDAGGENVGTPNYSAWSLQLTADGFARVNSRTAISATTVSVTGAVALDDGAPHHIALVRQLGSVRRLELWVDGVLAGSEPLVTNRDDGPYHPSNAADPDPISVGAQREVGSAFKILPFEGLIDDLKFYDRALTREEIENTAGCAVPIVPRVLNLDASRFGGPADVPNSHRFCVYLDAGQYDVTMVGAGQAPLARFTAWSDSGTGDWGTAYSIVGETSPLAIDAGIPLGETSMQLAFDGTTDKTVSFTLPAAERVYFAIEDGAVLDNQGGVSLVLTAPEPGPGVMLGTTIALLGALARRRRRRST